MSPLYWILWSILSLCRFTRIREHDRSDSEGIAGKIRGDKGSAMCKDLKSALPVQAVQVRHESGYIVEHASPCTWCVGSRSAAEKWAKGRVGQQRQPAVLPVAGTLRSNMRHFVRTILFGASQLRRPHRGASVVDCPREESLREGTSTCSVVAHVRSGVKARCGPQVVRRRSRGWGNRKLAREGKTCSLHVKGGRDAEPGAKDPN